MILSSSLKQRTNRSRRGFSLAEFAVVLAIMGIVVGALWGVVTIVRENLRRAQMEEQLTSVVQNVRSFYQGWGRVQDDSVPPKNDAASITHFLLKKGVIPPDMIRSRTATPMVADTPWGPRDASGADLAGGGLTVDTVGLNSTLHFRVSILGLRRSSCIALATKLSGAGIEGLKAAYINDMAVVAAAIAPPVAPEKAAVDCKAVPGAGENVVAFVYNLRVQE